jgi:pSer/pThr/pTyr-binding forkhead associated (FHA) protein
MSVDEDPDAGMNYADSTMTMDAPLAMHVMGGSMRAYWLRQISGPGAPLEIPLRSERMVIGRSRSADIQVDSPELSRKHAELRHENKEITIHDLDSRNGVFLNGVKIHSAALRGGDTLQIGNVAYVFVEGL